MEKRDLILQNKVLILGSTGLIGHQVFNYLNSTTDYQIIDIAYRKKLNQNTVLIDVKNDNEIISFINKTKPNYIINCIGVLNDKADVSIQHTIFLNAILPHKLKEVADKINSKLIHMSTDCVFSGLKGNSYIETDNRDGFDSYAKSKGLGEIISNSHLTLRTSVVGPELKENGSELFHWFMNQQKDILGYTNVYWSGVTSLELAKAVKWAIINNITGLYHVTNNKKISKNDLLILFKKHTNKKIKITPSSNKINDKSFIDSRKLIDYQIPSYEKMIEEMIELIQNNKSLYSQYNL